MKSLAMLSALFFALQVLPVSGATCSASSTGVASGSYTPNQSVPADYAGQVTINCQQGALDALPMTVNYSVDLSRGASVSYSPRDLVSGTSTLHYNLYIDATRTVVWGDTSGGTASVSGSLQLQSPLGVASASHTVYGRIFGGQNVVPGAYADSILLTVVY
jgi:spore coat protein U-like protein